MYCFIILCSFLSQLTSRLKIDYNAALRALNATHEPRLRIFADILNYSFKIQDHTTQYFNMHVVSRQKFQVLAQLKQKV